MQVAADVDEIIVGHAGDKVCYDVVRGSSYFLPVFGIPITAALNGIVEVVSEYGGVGVFVQNILHKPVIKAAQQGLHNFVIRTVQFRMAVNDIGVFVDQIPQITEDRFVHVQRRGVDAVFNQIGRNIGDDLAVGGSDEPLFLKSLFRNQTGFVQILSVLSGIGDHVADADDAALQRVGTKRLVVFAVQITFLHNCVKGVEVG